jgi:hypothetical protein
MRVKDLLSIVLDGFVVVVVITVIAAIATLLPYASVHRRITYAACAVVAVLGAACVVFQMWRLRHTEKTRELLSELLADGIEITQSVNEKVMDDQETIRDWCQRAELLLRNRLGESYVRRFHLGGSNVQSGRSMTVWKNNHRLETLAGFLTELK